MTLKTRDQQNPLRPKILEFVMKECALHEVLLNIGVPYKESL